MNPEQLQAALTRAIQALAELEAAIEAGNVRVLAARLYELGRALPMIREGLNKTYSTGD